MQRLLTTILGFTLLLLQLGCPKPESQTSRDNRLASPAEAAPKDTKLAEAHELIDARKWTEAAELARGELLENPTSSKWLVIMADTAMGTHRPDEVFNYVALMNPDDTQTLPVARLITSACQENTSLWDQHFIAAWTASERVLANDPEQDPLRFSLIEALQRQGYRHRACEHIDKLIRRGAARQKDLELAANQRGIVEWKQEKQSLDLQNSEIASLPPRAAARMHLQSKNFNVGIEKLNALRSHDGQWDDPESAALYGRLLAASQDFGSFTAWLASCPESVGGLADFWTAVGIALVQSDETEHAAAAFLSAIELDPTNPIDYQQLGQCLAKMGETVLADRIYARGKAVRGIQSLINKIHRQPDALFLWQTLAQRLNEVGRPLEALQWRRNEMKTRQKQLNDAESSGEKRQEIEAAITQLGSQLEHVVAAPGIDQAMKAHWRFGLSKSQFPIPGRQSLLHIFGTKFADATADRNARTNIAETATTQTIKMSDIALATGLDFQYFNRTPIALQQIRLHESLGGGIGVIDYDLDGLPDVMMSQGSGDPPSVRSDQSDTIFRNTGGQWHNVTTETGCTDDQYSFGVAVGDLNQDGWPDIVIGNLHQNRLLINCGDGTFQDRSGLIKDSQSRFTSSIGIGDISGDGLPDIVETNYLDDPNMFRMIAPPRNGVPAVMSPNSLTAAKNSWWKNANAGKFEQNSLERNSSEARNSLGLVLADIVVGSPGNEAFVGNDLGANRLWARPTSAQPLTDQASVRGLGFDHTGLATASMGIAMGDFDLDGNCDLHVTNFSNESSSLFLQPTPDSFTDRSAAFDLSRWTFPMVGFGSQAMDINLDGILDIAILNGHIEDLTSIGGTFRMLPQILLGSHSGRSFAPAVIGDSEGYWDRPALGRVLTSLDWNNDGLVDMIANHLDQPAALLENQTITKGHWLTIKLVGVDSERDAVGASIQATTIDLEQATSTMANETTAKRRQATPQQTVRWQTGADGYLCRNDSRLHFGFSESTASVEVTITWPSGPKQKLGILRVDQEYLCVEGEPPFTLR